MYFTNLLAEDDSDDQKTPCRVYANERDLLSSFAQN